MTYSFGNCSVCGKIKALKDGVCNICSNPTMDIFNTIMGEK